MTKRIHLAVKHQAQRYANASGRAGPNDFDFTRARRLMEPILHDLFGPRERDKATISHLPKET